MAEKRICAEHVYDRGARSMLSFPCGRPGKVEHDGKWYCGIHDPEKRAARGEARKIAWDAESTVWHATADLKAAKRDLLLWAMTVAGAPVGPVKAAEAKLEKAMGKLTALKGKRG